MNQDWSIQNRGEQCAHTGAPFAAGEYFHTLLFHEPGQFRREDLCESAFKNRPADAPVPFSVWRSKFEPSPQKAPEALAKQTAESLLRHYMADSDPKWRNVRYILAIMLERKRTLKEVQTVRGEDGSLSRVYQFPKTGEVLVIPDPQLHLDQIAQIQDEVAELLSGQVLTPPPSTDPEPSDPAPLDHEGLTPAPEPLSSEPSLQGCDETQATPPGPSADAPPQTQPDSSENAAPTFHPDHAGPPPYAE